jgi:hypothetical protein
MKKILSFTLVFLLLFGGIGLAQDLSNTQTEQYENKQFVYDLTENKVLSQTTLRSLQESAVNYFSNHNVEFYVQIVDLNGEGKVREGLYSLVEQFNYNSLQEKGVVLFIYDNNSGNYKLYVDDKLQNKINYYMIYNFMTQFDKSLSYQNLDQSLNENIGRLLDYFVLATEATVGSSQFEVNFEKAKELPTIQFFSLNEVYNEAEMRNEQPVEKEPLEIVEEDNNNGSMMGSIIKFTVIILLLILLVIGIVWFVKKRREESTEIIYEEVEEIEDDEEYLD